MASDLGERFFPTASVVGFVCSFTDVFLRTVYSFLELLSAYFSSYDPAFVAKVSCIFFLGKSEFHSSLENQP